MASSEAAWLAEIDRGEFMTEKGSFEIQKAWDKWSDHKSLIDLLPNGSYVKQRLLDVAVEISRGRTEKEFHYLLKDDENYATTRRIRHQFWNVFNHAISLDKPKITNTSIYSGIVSKQAFEKLIECDFRATYIFTQPYDIQAIQHDLLYEGYRYLDEIMAIPIMDSRGKPDHKAIQTKINIIKMMEDRLHGSVVQREQKYIENVEKKELHPMDSQKNLDLLQDEVNKLRKKLGKDVEVETAEVVEKDE